MFDDKELELAKSTHDKLRSVFKNINHALKEAEGLPKGISEAILVAFFRALDSSKSVDNFDSYKAVNLIDDWFEKHIPDFSKGT